MKFIFIFLFCYQYFFLLKSFKKENKFRIPFFIIGAISFGFALNVKPIAFQMIIPIAIMILFYSSFNEKLNFGFFKNKKNIFKVISLILIFFVVSTVSFLATFPRYYDDPINQMLTITEGSREIGMFATFPTLEKNYFYRVLLTSHVIFFPHFMDSYFHESFPVEARNSALGEGLPFNYSTIPLTFFFFIGIIYMI